MPDRPDRRLPLGRIAGHRGRNGDVTVRVFDGEAGWWTEVREVWIEAGPSGQAETRAVRESRAYRDRLVLHLAGIEDPTAAEGLRGRNVWVDAASAPRLPAGRYYRAALVGFEVRDRRGTIGRAADWLVTSGRDLLVVRPSEDPSREILVPWVEEIVESVDEEQGVIVIRPPDGLLELDREGPE